MNADATLGEARQFVQEHREAGTNCPCCHQLVKLWKHQINSQIAYVLVRMYRLHGTGWVHVQSEVKPRNGGMFSIAQLWGLIEPRRVDPLDDKRMSGIWRLTEAGRAFVCRETTIPKYAHIFDGRVDRFSTEQRSITDALGAKFSYSELMAG